MNLTARIMPYLVRAIPYADKGYKCLIESMNYVQPVFLLCVRLFWGWQFFLTGKGKLVNLGQTAEFFAGLNIPLPTLNAFMAGMTECFGGLLLLAGIASRVIAIPLIFTMIVAYLTAHIDAVKTIWSQPDTFVSQEPFLFLLASLIILIFGPGRFSADTLLKRYTLHGNK